MGEEMGSGVVARQDVRAWRPYRGDDLVEVLAIGLVWAVVRCAEALGRRRWKGVQPLHSHRRGKQPHGQSDAEAVPRPE